jgi:hypothetical protein
MKSNVGGLDKILRIVAGLALIGLGIAGIGAPWTFVGVIPLATGLVGWCPLYLPFGISTCKKQGVAR